jgi:hypothetical protein
LGDDLSRAIQSSIQWKRDDGWQRTNCVSMTIPEHQFQDVLIKLWVGQEEGFRISEALDLLPA